MLTTVELIAGIKDDYANSFTVEKLVRYLDRVQRMVFLDDTWAMEYYNNDDTEFPYPILPTVDGQLSYTIDDGVLTDSAGNALDITFEGKPVEVSKVVNVFRNGTSFTQLHTTRGYGMLSRGPDNNLVSIRGEKYHKAVCRLTEKTPSSNPTITFVDNPFKTTDEYYVTLAIVPPKISSKSSPMVLNIDKWERALIDGVVGECELSVNGESKRADKFLNYWIPKIRNSYNESMGEFYDMGVGRKRFG